MQNSVVAELRKPYKAELEALASETKRLQAPPQPLLALLLAAAPALMRSDTLRWHLHRSLLQACLLQGMRERKP